MLFANGYRYHMRNIGCPMSLDGYGVAGGHFGNGRHSVVGCLYGNQRYLSWPQRRSLTTTTTAVAGNENRRNRNRHRRQLANGAADGNCTSSHCRPGSNCEETSLDCLGVLKKICDKGNGHNNAVLNANSSTSSPEGQFESLAPPPSFLSISKQCLISMTTALFLLLTFGLVCTVVGGIYFQRTNHFYNFKNNIYQLMCIIAIICGIIMLLSSGVLFRVLFCKSKWPPPHLASSGATMAVGEPSSTSPVQSMCCSASNNVVTEAGGSGGYRAPEDVRDHTTTSMSVTTTNAVAGNAQEPCNNAVRIDITGVSAFLNEVIYPGPISVRLHDNDDAPPSYSQCATPCPCPSTPTSSPPSHSHSSCSASNSASSCTSASSPPSPSSSLTASPPPKYSTEPPPRYSQLDVHSLLQHTDIHHHHQQIQQTHISCCRGNHSRRHSNGSLDTTNSRHGLESPCPVSRQLCPISSPDNQWRVANDNWEPLSTTTTLVQHGPGAEDILVVENYRLC